MLHVHLFLAAPLGESRVDQHQSRVPVREHPHHTGPAADLTVQPLDHIVGADARPVLTGKVTLGQRFLNAVLDFLGRLLQLHRSQLGNNSFRFFTGGFLVQLADGGG